ncbi:MAG: imidazole glycerol phosphate synthase subunit HisF [Deltaproteobacteria bacterium]|nr:imidazole glycerol phosphate synthase subunit HisF [Deltaproteobacteria bacterium]
MANIRVIARLDIKGPNLVKGVHLEGLRVLGKPNHFARHYFETGADEILYMDVVASLYGRNNLLHIVERTAKEVFIPLMVGGGLRSLEDIKAVLRAGADKVALNTAVINRPELIREASRKFGSSTIVVSIEAIKQPDGRYEAFTDNGRQATGVDVFEWAVRAAELGAGEIMITSVDQEGTGRGYAIPLTRKIADAVSIPVIACGGAGQVQHVQEVITEGKADAACVASMLHYQFIQEMEHDEDYSDEGNIEFLKRKRTYSRIQGATIPQIKECLIQNGVCCRTLPKLEEKIVNA